MLRMLKFEQSQNEIWSHRTSLRISGKQVQVVFGLSHVQLLQRVLHNWDLGSRP